MLNAESRGPVLYVTLNRPEVRNAFNDELISKLTDVFSGVGSETRVVVMSGEGKSFCAGGDLEWMRKAAAYTEEQNYQDAVKLGKLFESIANCPAVVIAKVHGAAFGGGAGVVACADIAIAETETKFAFSEVRLGLIPGTISAFVIPKIGAGHARALFTTGEAFDAAHAFHIGLVHQVASSESLDEAVNAKLKWILAAGPNAVAASKKIVLDGSLPIEECARRLAAARASEEGKEGVGAFLEKRKASFVVEI
ncbi:MAG: enoyl-CoA hydratase/isomerase family protein [Fimbriimonadaceae bacterium]|nr:enoyl-CoA hydratase/isomerase family protein [Fimbriimonadaceae bacterium]